MLVYAGIDEAGYGPMLGPLCVGCAVFVLDGHDPADGPPPLWRQLSGAVCRRAGDRRRRIAVNDSKKLKTPNEGPGHPLRHLERGVLSFCPGQALPDTDEALFGRLDARVPDRPWLEGTAPLPVAHTADELRIARARLTRVMRSAGVRCEAVWCAAVDPEAFNRGVDDLGSKAEVNFRAAMQLAERLWQRWPEAHPRVLVDRHGGRTRYAESLASTLGADRVETVAETAALSRYRVHRGSRSLTVSFAVDGDERFLPVALASMTAKYVRELLMARLNRFFQGHLPELRATAGYFGDARRYLAEIEPVMRRLRVPAAQLVRAV